MKLSVVIPAHNEENTIEEIIERVFKINFTPINIDLEVIVVNDGSKDNTAKIVKNLFHTHQNLKFFENEKQLGKSQTVKKGVLKTSGDWVICQDADLEYEPNEINNLLSYAFKDNYDVVFGNRFNKNNKTRYLHFYLGNRFVSTISNVFTFFRFKKLVPDMEVCYKLMKGEIARDVFTELKSISMFGLEPEITARLSRYMKNNKHLSLGIIPISYFPREIAQGKHMKVSEGIKATWEIIKYNLF